MPLREGWGVARRTMKKAYRSCDKNTAFVPHKPRCSLASVECGMQGVEDPTQHDGNAAKRKLVGDKWNDQDPTQHDGIAAKRELVGDSWND